MNLHCVFYRIRLRRRTDHSRQMGHSKWPTTHDPNTWPTSYVSRDSWRLAEPAEVRHWRKRWRTWSSWSAPRWLLLVLYKTNSRTATTAANASPPISITNVPPTLATPNECASFSPCFSSPLHEPAFFHHLLYSIWSRPPSCRCSIAIDIVSRYGESAAAMNKGLKVTNLKVWTLFTALLTWFRLVISSS